MAVWQLQVGFGFYFFNKGKQAFLNKRVLFFNGASVAQHH
jgi:hypothetical protein